MQTIDTRDCLHEVVLLQLLVDIENRVARLVEAGQKLVNDDEQVGLALGAEILDDSCHDFARPPRLVHLVERTSR